MTLRGYARALAAALLLGLLPAACARPPAAPSPAASSGSTVVTLCNSQTLPVSGGYLLQNNEWGSRAPECITTAGNPAFTVAQSSIANPTGGGPGGYPSVYKGCHWDTCTSGSGMPVQVASIRPGTVTTSWDTVQPAGSGVYNAAYDIWINQTPTMHGHPSGAELMIWLNHTGPVHPTGKLAATGVRIGGYRYDVWLGRRSPGWKAISYEMTSPATSVSNLDLQPLAADALSRGALQQSWYLTGVEAGFEIWQGGAGLATSSFSVNIAGR